MAVKFNLFQIAQRWVNSDLTLTREAYTFLFNLFNASGSGQTLGTAALQNIGTAGPRVPLLNTANEWGAQQTFDDGDLILKGATTGATTVKAVTNAGGVITVPNATDTLVAKSTTDILSNKTLASPALTGTVTGPNAIPLSILAQVASGAVLGNVTATTANVTAISAGQLPGTATNDNASAGRIGEYITATVTSGAAVTLTTNTVTNVASVSLTAGDWRVTGNVAFTITGAGVTNIQAWTTTVSATAPTSPAGGGRINLVTGSNWGDGTVIPAGVNRITLTTSATVYLGTYALFGSGTCAAYGCIEAWRSR